MLWYANYPNLGTAETYEPAKRVTRSRYGLPLAIPYLVMFTKGPLHVPITSGSVVGGVTWGLRKGFDVAPRGARAPRAWPRARPLPVTARFGHPLLENRFPSHLYRIRSLGKLRAPLQTSGARSDKYTFFGQVKNLAHVCEFVWSLRTILV